MRGILFFIVALFLGVCGYVPTSKVAGNIFDDKVYVNMELSLQGPRNNIFIADTPKEVVISKLGQGLALKYEAGDVISIRINNPELIPLIYDQNGCVASYKAKLDLEFKVVLKDGGVEHFNTNGSYSSDVSSNSTISDTARHEAIRSASSEAFGKFISAIAIKGQKRAA